MILDEAHNIKNFKSLRWQTLLNFNTDDNSYSGFYETVHVEEKWFFNRRANANLHGPR
jgi:hypothetical protein